MPGYDDELTRIVEELNRATPGTPRDASPIPVAPVSTPSLDRLLAHAARANASDVLLVAGTVVFVGVVAVVTGLLRTSARRQ